MRVFFLKKTVLTILYIYIYIPHHHRLPSPSSPVYLPCRHPPSPCSHTRPSSSSRCHPPAFSSTKAHMRWKKNWTLTFPYIMNSLTNNKKKCWERVMHITSLQKAVSCPKFHEYINKTKGKWIFFTCVKNCQISTISSNFS